MAPIDSAEATPPEAVFTELSGNNTETPTEIESLCVSCGDNGMTRLMLTKIPHYRELILMSFSCEKCGYRNNEVQSGGKIQEMGIRFKVKIRKTEDLCRQVVKSDHAAVTVPEIGLEIPALSQKACVTTVEGILERTIEGLLQDQPVRKHLDPEGAEQIDNYVVKIKGLISIKEPFHLIVEDASGNSFVENPYAPNTDPDREVSQFSRTKEQDHMLGLYTQEEIDAKSREDEEEGDQAPLASNEASSPSIESMSTATSESALLKVEGEKSAAVLAQEDSQASVRERIQKLLGSKTEDEDGSSNQLDLTGEVLKFPTNCCECNSPATTNMKVTKIPHFKEVVIMATFCDYCGHKSNEVKAGGGIEDKGKKITLVVNKVEDLSRDILKAETCGLKIPELAFEMGGHAIGGRFSTVEGILHSVQDEVKNNPFLGAISGDSATKETKKRLSEFHDDIDLMISGEKPFTLVLDDPAGNSYLQSLTAPDPDPQLVIEEYERSVEQNDELGLTHMKTENYGEEKLLSADS